MRLTVHLKGVPKKKVEVPNKDGKMITKNKLFNTLTFEIKDESEVDRILSDIESQRQSSILVNNVDTGAYASHYISNKRIPGTQRVKKKK